MHDLRTAAFNGLVGLGAIALLVAPAWAQSMPWLRIGLADGVGRAVVATSTEGVLVDGHGQSVAAVRPLESWQVRQELGALVFTSGARRVRIEATPARLVARAMGARTPLVYGAGRWYRGELELRRAPGGVTVVNYVPIENYLYGVVPAEMEPRWPLEALKAQAVAARTYALAKIGQFADRGYDLRPTTENQVYKGASAETVVSDAAVDQTAGQVLTYDGRIIPAYFHSCSGGYTETSAAVWGEPHPYLQAVPDYDQQSPRYLWQKNVQAPTLRAALARHGVEVGEILRFDVVVRSYSGRAQRVRVSGTRGETEVSGDTVRQSAGLYSTLFNVMGFGGSRGVPSVFAFAGRGHGHGLGLSQWGAKALGERGYLYSQILAYYYPSTRLSSVETSMP